MPHPLLSKPHALSGACPGNKHLEAAGIRGDAQGSVDNAPGSSTAPALPDSTHPPGQTASQLTVVKVDLANAADARHWKRCWASNPPSQRQVCHARHSASQEALGLGEECDTGAPGADSRSHPTLPQTPLEASKDTMQAASTHAPLEVRVHASPLLMPTFDKPLQRWGREGVRCWSVSVRTPWQWGAVLLPVLVHGATVVGLAEWHNVRTALALPNFPDDYPRTTAYMCDS